MCLAIVAADALRAAGLQRVAATIEQTTACVNPVTNQVLLEFNREPTPGTIIFQLMIFVVTVATLTFLWRRQPRLLAHYGVIVAGVLIFEIFTAPMWLNERLGRWAYAYQDVSWVLTLGWSTMILIGLHLIDRLLPAAREWQRYLAAIAILTPAAIIAERSVVLLGIRSYSPEVLERIGGTAMPIINVSVIALYYLPVFLALTIGFYKFWAPIIDGHQMPEPSVRWPLLRRFLYLFAGIFFFEIMIEPMVNNHGFPAWSYVLYDISLVMTGFWVVLLTVCTWAIDRLLARATLPVRFGAYVLLIGLVAAPIEGWFIRNGFREYGPSAVANFSGFRTAIGDIPIEPALAVPLYLALVLGAVLYWERMPGYDALRADQPTAAPAPHPLATGAD
ncbi:MAG: hypothetical protein IT340_13410 [Chloroflexi bacterium]|nr:hypothetical protein [Chloroflexota bacterium]